MKSSLQFKIFLVAASLFVGFVSPLRAADAAGRWKSEFATQGGQMKYTYELKSDDGKITGQAVRERGDEVSTNLLVEGKIKDDAISFVEEAQIQGQDIRIEYAGKISGDEMKLSRKVGDYGTTDVVLKREKTAPAVVVITGKWQAEFDTQVGHQKYLYDFKLDGENLTGTAVCQLNEEKMTTDIKGKLIGSDITFSEPLKFQDQVLDISYSGKVTDDEIKLTRKVGDVATEDVVAHRVKEPASK